MKKSFTLGAVSGISALAIAFPVVAQIAGAQSSTATASSTASTKVPFRERAPLTQDEVQAMADRDNAFLLNVDAFVAVQKEAIQSHRIALEAAADIADETERNDVVKAANDAMRSAIETAVTANPDLKTAMMPMGPGGPHGGMKGHGRGPGPEMLAQKLGMTPDELKAELDAGATIEEIAAEKGITLPPRPAFKGDHRLENDMDNDDEVQD